MADVPVRELRNDTAGVLRRVEAGEDVTITVHGRPVARLVATAPAQRWFSREEVIDLIEHHAADPGLRDDLALWAGDTTDEMRKLW